MGVEEEQASVVKEGIGNARKDRLKNIFSTIEIF